MLIDICKALPYILRVIKSFRHKGLKTYWERGNAKGLNPQWVDRISRILRALDVADKPEDMNLPGYYFHALKGESKGRFAVRVTGNWRITFRFDGPDAEIIDLEDYH